MVAERKMCSVDLESLKRGEAGDQIQNFARKFPVNLPANPKLNVDDYLYKKERGEWRVLAFALPL